MQAIRVLKDVYRVEVQVIELEAYSIASLKMPIMWPIYNNKAHQNLL